MKKTAKTNPKVGTQEQTWEDYLALTRNKEWQRGTKIGKKAVRDFVRGFWIRMRATGGELEKYVNKNIHGRYSQLFLLFMKYLSMTNGFEDAVFEGHVCPIIVVFGTKKDGIRLGHNITSENDFRLVFAPMLQSLTVRWLKDMYKEAKGNPDVRAKVKEWVGVIRKELTIKGLEEYAKQEDIKKDVRKE